MPTNDDKGRLPWRVGRSVGRTIYQQIGPEPSKEDVLIGIMDTPELAYRVVRAINAHEKGIRTLDLAGMRQHFESFDADESVPVNRDLLIALLDEIERKAREHAIATRLLATQRESIEQLRHERLAAKQQEPSR